MCSSSAQTQHKNLMQKSVYRKNRTVSGISYLEISNIIQYPSKVTKYMRSARGYCPIGHELKSERRNFLKSTKVPFISILTKTLHEPKQMHHIMYFLCNINI